MPAYPRVMCDRLPLLPHLGWAVGGRKTAQNGPPAPEIVGCGMPQNEPRGTYGESADATGHVLMAIDVVWAHVPTQSRIRVDAVAVSHEIWPQAATVLGSQIFDLLDRHQEQSKHTPEGSCSVPNHPHHAKIKPGLKFGVSLNRPGRSSLISTCGDRQDFGNVDR